MASWKSYVAAAAALTLLDGATAAVTRRWGTPAGPFCTDFTPFTYAGCFAEPSSGRALPFISDISTSNMTPQTCVSFCKGNNYRYAGIEYYGECYCGASVAGVQIADSLCNYPCTGDSTKACGGSSILSVYQDPTFPSVDNTVISDYKSSGCYTDNGSARTLVYRQDSLDAATMTVDKCLAQCKAGGYALAGLEFASECYCGVVLGNSTSQVDSAQCNMPCRGNPSQICGGAALFNLYVATDLQSRQPCNFGQSSSSSVVSSTTTTSSTSTKPTTTMTTTTSAALCTKTSEPECEYSCGSWCSNPLPPFNSRDDCKVASSHCRIQIAGCFSHAKYPDSMKCFEYSGWCDKVDSYCDSSCKSGKCSKEECKSKNPLPGSPPPPSTTVYPCPSKTPTPSPTSVPVPTPSNICVQPHYPEKGYSKDHPCGDIALPCLTCNNDKSDYDSGSMFKLYTSKDTKECSSYKKSSISQACKDACLAQYNSCIGTYAESCKGNNKNNKDNKDGKDNKDNKKDKGRRDGEHEHEDDYEGAKNKCSSQYQDCLRDNSKVSTDGGRCSSWNSGW